MREGHLSRTPSPLARGAGGPIRRPGRAAMAQVVLASGLLAWGTAGRVAASSAPDPNLALAGPPAVAPQNQAAAPRSGPDDTETRERLLKLVSGQVLRGSSRKVDGQWEIRQRKGWTRLPEQMVATSFLEREVLREQKQRRASVGRNDMDAWLGVAAWELDAGLYDEGLRDLDRVLEDDPDHMGALLLLANPRLPFGLPRGEDGGPASLSTLLDYGGQAPRAIQELVVRELSHRKGSELQQSLMKKELSRRLRSPKPSQRVFATLACRRLFPTGLALQELLRRSLVDPSADVRTGAALALRDTGEEGLMLPLVRALESSSSVLRTHAARSLGTMGFAAAVAPLATRLATLRTAAGGDGWTAPASHIFVGRQIAFVQDFEPEVATSAVIAKPQIGVAMEGATLDVRVFGIGGMGGGGSSLSYSHATETKALRRALSHITRAEVRDTNTAWSQWWDSHGNDWMARHLPDRELESGTTVSDASVSRG